ncbi:MAG: glycosyltransferase [Geitlerinemataceae cyanobacterium]
MPVISIIIPVYNGEKTIEETVRSVLNQRFQDFEIIIINDGSKDKTLEAINQIADSRIQVYSYSNSGQGASRNRGLVQANGQYVAFLDADDLWTPDKLEAQLDALQANPAAAVAYSWTDVIDEFGNFLRPGSHLNISGDVYPHLLLTNILENGSNPLIRREAIDRVGGFDESLPPAEDWDLYLRLAAIYPFIVVPRPQILYRVYANSASTNVFHLEAVSVKVIEQAFNQVPDSLRYLKSHSLANLYKYLTFKSLETSSGRIQGFAALHFLVKAIFNDRSFMKQRRIIVSSILKSLSLIFLPRQLLEKSRQKLEQFSHTNSLLMHGKLNPF